MLSLSAPLRRLQTLSHGLRRASLRPQRLGMATAATIGEASPFGHEGKLVIVTGGANGIGQCVSLEFARCGANVLCADVDDEKGKETEALAANLAGDVKYMHADMTDAAVPAKVVSEAQQWQGGQAVGVLVNNVGIQEDNGTPHLCSRKYAEFSLPN